MGLRLYDYQTIGRKALANNTRLYLADDLGLGKTPQAVCAMADVDAQRPLIICPASVVATWERNVTAWTPHRKMPVILSYDRARMLGIGELLKIDPDLMILDEAHYCSHMDAQRTKIVLGCAHRVPRVWLLSGTPMRNHAGELYPMLRAIWPDKLTQHGVKTYGDYLNKFTVSVLTKYGPKVIKNRNVLALQDLLAGIMLRRTWDDVTLSLPPLRWETWHQSMEDVATLNHQLRMMPGYEALRMHLMHGEFPTDSPHLATLRRLTGVAKAVPAAASIAQELADGALDKVVVMYYHKDVATILRRQLEAFGIVTLGGETSADGRREAEDRFQSDPGVRVFLGQITAAGMGLTLTAGHEIVMVEQTWSPEDDRQAVKRIHRVSQTEPCRARLVTLPDTIDEQVARVRMNKLKMIGEIVHL